MWPSRRLPSSILVTVLIQAVNSEADKHAAGGDKKVAAPAVGDKKVAEGDKQVAVVVKKIGEVPLLNYHDIFLPGKGGKPTLGAPLFTVYFLCIFR